VNLGYTPGEIAETLHMPASLDREWSARGYYGTLRHNAKAVYQKYLGWYDAIPPTLTRCRRPRTRARPSSTWAAPMR